MLSKLKLKSWLLVSFPIYWPLDTVVLAILHFTGKNNNYIQAGGFKADFI